jgi:protein involved in polysaccharide export with SLBB domain
MSRALMIALAITLAGCAADDLPPTQVASAAALTEAASGRDYALGPGDKLQIVVYGETELTGEQIVGPDGSLTMPLIGKVAAAGRTVEAVSAEITTRLADGFVRQPSVAVTITNYRPFYILGEVNTPGQYEYAKGMTLFAAVARAGGYTYRAKRNEIYLKREGVDQEVRVDLTADFPILPGDTIRIAERFF